jgi:uncharacterized coiled-coil protein SlyX
MNQELWDALTAKVAERDRLQVELDALTAEIQQAAASLQADLAQLGPSASVEEGT